MQGEKPTGVAQFARRLVVKQLRAAINLGKWHVFCVGGGKAYEVGE